MTDLVSRMNTVWENGIATKNLVVLNTSTVYIAEKGCNFVVRMLKGDGLKKKESNINAKTKVIVDPFCTENRNPMLVVKEIATHTLMLNKFPVLKNHCVLVTNDFQSQLNPLNLSDFTALSSVLREVPSLVFYNCGVDSGASQRHKHMQLIPFSQFEKEMTPFDEVMLKENHDRDKVCQCELYDFTHSMIHVSCEDLVNPEVLLSKYNLIMEDMKQKREKEGRKLESYNFLLLREWMFVVPRSCESCNGVNVNSLGFSGSFLAKNEELLSYLKEVGPLSILKRVVN
ncbi:hypothetical protein WA577_004605 [Blastocystis sp. JDR]